ncbi:CPBP family intramembrane glutamic endopeptidase [Brachybacterium sp. YJGR34]|uniref:CPBP family intramembrane glutamic endopeptidase n=1 Tax=Brachybacterium sp. YJGR34 TaxID=2059911 RepID=UPI000E0AB645|nr:CPBP family intramembrane glutamic endopeptidase [Brachybacterium sp. YJGR34]
MTDSRPAPSTAPRHEATPALTGRPIRVLMLWALSLLVLATLATVAQDQLGVPGELLSLVMLAPALACAVVLVRPSWMPEPWRAAAVPAVLRASLLAVAATAVFLAVLAILTGRAPSWPPATSTAPAVLLLAQALGALAEEIGWRGLVQRCGEQLARPAVVSAIAGFVFGATHLGYWGLGVLPVLTFAVTAMLMSLTITTIYVGSFWQRMLPATLVHLGVNLAGASLAPPEEPLMTSPAALAAAAAMLAAALAGRAALSLLSQRAR